eukprot:COSAG01_NODE_363_length_18113_cov_45.041690_24_plen_79_part_00
MAAATAATPTQRCRLHDGELGGRAGVIWSLPFPGQRPCGHPCTHVTHFTHFTQRPAAGTPRLLVSSVWRLQLLVVGDL